MTTVMLVQVKELRDESLFVHGFDVSELDLLYII